MQFFSFLFSSTAKVHFEFQGSPIFFLFQQLHRTFFMRFVFSSFLYFYPFLFSSFYSKTLSVVLQKLPFYFRNHSDDVSFSLWLIWIIRAREILSARLQRWMSYRCNLQLRVTQFRVANDPEESSPPVWWYRPCHTHTSHHECRLSSVLSTLGA